MGRHWCAREKVPNTVWIKASLQIMSLISQIFIYAIPILLAVSMHEAAHGWVAHLLGDSTAKQLGRLTANPLKHIDPIGTVAVPLVLILVAGFPFGWAKPVPVDVSNFQHPQKDMALVALAGPASNFFMAICWMLVMLLAIKVLPASNLAMILKEMAKMGVFFNIVLMVLNLLPVPPLDGGRIVTGVLPFKAAVFFARYELIGLLLVIFLLASGFLGKILMPAVQAVQANLYAIFGLG